jgi:hypothetical protein
MAVSGYIQKTLRMKPEVKKIFDDLDRWLDHCRFNLLPYNPADLYKSAEYRRFQQEQDYLGRKARREAKARQHKREHNGINLSN